MTAAAILIGAGLLFGPIAAACLLLQLAALDDGADGAAGDRDPHAESLNL